MDTVKKVTEYFHRKILFPKRFIYGLAIFLPTFFALYTNAQTKKEALENVQATAPVGYVVYFIKARDTGFNREMWQALFKIMGPMTSGFSMTNDSISSELTVIPAAGKSREALIGQLQAIPEIRKVSVAALSKPAKTTELATVRKLFTGVGLDAATVSDKQLSLFLFSQLDRTYGYYVDQDRSKNAKGLNNMRIKRWEENPNYSPSWRNKMPVTQDTAQGSDSLVVVRDVVIQNVEEREAPPPPPPPPSPPNHLKDMSNEQIRQWIKKNDPRHLKDNDIQIKRTAEEVVITVQTKDGPETFSYQIKK
ncbi:MAG: hypothetical protein ACJ75B_16910 [Flavisolibacter sp.]